VTAQHTSFSAMTDGIARGKKSAQVVLDPETMSQEHQNLTYIAHASFDGL